MAGAVRGCNAFFLHMFARMDRIDRDIRLSFHKMKERARITRIVFFPRRCAQRTCSDRAPSNLHVAQSRSCCQNRIRQDYTVKRDAELVNFFAQNEITSGQGLFGDSRCYAPPAYAEGVERSMCTTGRT